MTIPKIGTGIQVSSFSFGVSTSVSGQGQLVGRRQHTPLTIVREVDKASPLLWQAAVGASPLGTVKLSIQPPGGEVGDSVVITLSKAIEAGDSWSGPASEQPTESISFVYSAISIKYTQGAATG